LAAGLLNIEARKHLELKRDEIGLPTKCSDRNLIYKQRYYKNPEDELRIKEALRQDFKIRDG
jgi:hypothetical protein